MAHQPRTLPFVGNILTPGQIWPVRYNLAVIEFNAVSLGKGGDELLRDFSWQMPDPGIYLLLGGNGTGKTLLSSILTGRIRASAGQTTIMGEPVNRAGGQVWYADAAVAIRDDESVEEYVEYELSCSGSAANAADDCLAMISSHHADIADQPLSRLPHHELLIVQIAMAVHMAGPLRILDGHLTYLDDHFCRLASRMLQSFAVHQQDFLLLTAGRTAAELPDLRDIALLERGRPIRIRHLESQDGISTGMQKLSSSTAISVYYRNRDLSPNELVSGETYRVLSRLEGGLNLELTGTLDECLAELASRGIEIRRIDLRQP